MIRIVKETFGLVDILVNKAMIILSATALNSALCRSSRQIHFCQ